MKKYIKQIGLLALSGILLTACNEDDNTGDAMTTSSPTNITLSALTSTIDESAIDADDSSTYMVTFSASIPAAVTQDAVVDVWQSGGTADTNDYHFAGDDYIIIPAGSTSGSISVEVYQTGDIEGDETLVFEAASRDGYHSLTPFSHTVTITNDYINDVLDLTLSWDAEVVNGDVTITSLCDIDYDLLLADDGGNLLGYIAGTSACPEHGSLSGLADGTYYLLADLYDNPLVDYGFTDAIPITLEYSQDYFPTSGVISNASQTLDMPGATDFSFITGVAILEVSGGYNYTLTGL